VVTKSQEEKRLASLVEAAGKLPALQRIFLFAEERGAPFQGCLWA
jgi:hypothetical protein